MYRLDHGKNMSRKELIRIIGALEGLSRVYTVLLYAGRGVEANLVRSLIDQYILRLGVEADKVRLKEHIEMELPSEPLTLNDMVSFLKSVSVKERNSSMNVRSSDTHFNRG